MNNLNVLNKKNIEIIKGKLTVTFVSNSLRDFQGPNALEMLEKLLDYYFEEAKNHPVAVKIIFDKENFPKEFSAKMIKILNEITATRKNHLWLNFSFSFYKNEDKLVMFYGIADSKGIVKADATTDFLCNFSSVT